MEEHIITIRERDIHEADKAFAEFMGKAEKCFNERSSANPRLYKNCSPSDLEKITEQLLIDVCPSTPFLPSDIKLVAGHSFPDIMTTQFYGVEVKSTTKDKWTSTGSSIVESTRSEFVERIYMLFGSLGSNPPAFKCKPYQDCLSSIAVTHSPRYLIDMELSDKDTIFSKMQTDYDVFRTMEEKEKFAKLRRYYIKKAKEAGREEMPWWLGENSAPTLSIFNEQNNNLKHELRIRSMILFPSVFGDDKERTIAYKKISIWMCNRYSLLCYNMRDNFSAGGQIKSVDGKLLMKPYPKIVESLLKSKYAIKRLLENPDVDIISDIEEYWEFNYNESKLYEAWKEMVVDYFKVTPSLKHVPIKDLLERKTLPDFSLINKRII